MKHSLQLPSRLSFALLVASVFLAVLPTTVASQTFEGSVQFQMKNEQGSPRFTYMTKDNNVRIEMEGPRGEAVILMDAKLNKRYMLMVPMKSYMEMNPQMQMPQPKEADAKKRDVSKTGKTETILGYECDQYVIKDEKGETELWVAKGLGKFIRVGMGRQQQSTGSGWEEDFATKGLFPLRVITRDASGAEKSRMEATKVEKKTLESSLFQIPSDYTKMEMPMMGRQRN